MPSVTSYLTTGAGHFEFMFVVPVDKKSLSNNAPGCIRPNSQSRVIFLHAILRRRPSGCSVTWYSSFPSSCALLRSWATKCLFFAQNVYFQGNEKCHRVDVHGAERRTNKHRWSALHNVEIVESRILSRIANCKEGTLCCTRQLDSQRRFFSIGG